MLLVNRDGDEVYIRFALPEGGRAGLQVFDLADPAADGPDPADDIARAAADGLKVLPREVALYYNQAQAQYWDVSYNFRGQEHRTQMTTPPGATGCWARCPFRRTGPWWPAITTTWPIWLVYSWGPYRPGCLG